VPYFHVVFTLPAAIADIAYQNKAVIYDILFTASAETMTAIAADPKHLGARRKPRPHISIDGDTFAYVAREKLHHMIADGLSSPKRGRRR
jgi:hypothetical protein